MTKAQVLAKRMESILLERGVPPRKVRSRMSDMCGISIQAIYQWFNGKTQHIEHENLANFAKRLSLTIEQVTGEELIPPTSESRRRVNQIIDDLNDEKMDSLLLFLDKFLVDK